MQEDLGWRKLEERREELKVLFNKSLEGMKIVSRLVKMVVEKLRKDEGTVRWEMYEVLGESLNWIMRMG